MDRSVASLDRQQKVSGERRVSLTRGWSATYSEPADVPRVGRSESASGRLARLWGRRGSLESFATTARYRFNRVRQRGSPSLQNHSSTALAKIIQVRLHNRFATGSLQRRRNCRNCRCLIQKRERVNCNFRSLRLTTTSAIYIVNYNDK